MKIAKKPTAYPVKGRENIFRAYGINPLTQERKPFNGTSAEEAESKAQASFDRIPKADTLTEFYLKAYLPTIEHRSENWQNQIAWAMDKHVIPEFGNRPLHSIERPELQKLFNRLLRGMKVSSARKVRIVFSGVLNLAVADKKMESNPLQFVKLPTADEPDKTALTFEQLGDLWWHSKPELRVVLLLGACSGGLRIGEICGTSRMLLTSDDVLHVRQQVLQLSGGARIEKKLKTPQTRRDIPLPADLAEAIRTESQGRLYLAGTSRNKFQLPNNVTEDLAIACKAAGIPVITPHELRHTFISLMENEIEAPAAIVAFLAGKKDKRISGAYSHSHKTQLLKWGTVYYKRFNDAVKKGQCSRASETHSA